MPAGWVCVRARASDELRVGGQAGWFSVSMHLCVTSAGVGAACRLKERLGLRVGTMIGKRLPTGLLAGINIYMALNNLLTQCSMATAVNLG